MEAQLSIKVRNVEESQTLAISATAARMKRAGVDIVSLTAGEPDFPTPEHVKEAAMRAIRENFTHYTPNEGIPELKEAVCAKFLNDNGLRFSPDRILVSTGAKQSIYNVLQAICNPGDEVLILSPYWVSYPEMVRLADAMPVIIPSVIDQDFRISIDLLRRSVSPRTKAIIINSPGNPSGNVLTREEIDELAGLVEGAGIFVLSDEIYEKILFDGCTHHSIGSCKAIEHLVVSINGLSKAYAMTGWRVGYLGGPIEVVRAAAKVQSQSTSNPNSIAQKAALAALTGDQSDIRMMSDEFARRRDIALHCLKDIPELRFVRPQGAFYILLGIANFLGRKGNGKRMAGSSDVATFLLNEWKVAVIPGIAFGVDSCLRLSFACSADELKRGLERIATGLRSLER